MRVIRFTVLNRSSFRKETPLPRSIESSSLPASNVTVMTHNSNWLSFQKKRSILTPGSENEEVHNNSLCCTGCPLSK
jgi:hypothetical protein